MATRFLPARPSLSQLKLQARELRKSFDAGSAAARARVDAHHPTAPSEGSRLSLADAQLVIAREYGFRSWPRLKEFVETAARLGVFEPHPRFEDAVHAIDHGDALRLQQLLAEYPELVRARTNLEPPYHYFTAATLLHHVAGNPDRGRLQGTLPPLPANIVAVAAMLLDAGADVDAATLGPNGGTTLGLLVTSKQASDAGVSGPLIELLVERGARIDLDRTDALDGPLANHAPRAAEKLIEMGARPDLLAAAALGRMDLLRGFFDGRGRVLQRPRRGGRTLSERDAIGLAMLFSYVNGHPHAVDFLLDRDGNWDMIGVNNGTALHRAAWAGDLPMVERLVARGADITNRANPFNSTPMAWAAHNRQQHVFDWFRANCAIDLHDAVCFDLREHVEARLREDPESVNRRIDQWDLPRCAPLHWAVWTHCEDVAGSHTVDAAEREALVRLLLDYGADPNIVAGDGSTPLDIAIASGAAGISALLEERGAKR